MDLKFPQTQADVPLHKAIKIFKILENKDISEIAKQLSIIAIYTDHDVKDLARVKLKQINLIFEKISSILIESPRPDFKREIELGGKHYGFIPDFTKISTGEFIDIDNLSPDGFGVFNKMLAILYRPIIGRSGKFYKIVDYMSEHDDSKHKRERTFLHMDFETARGATSFFLTYLNELAKQSNLSLQEKVK